VKNKDQKKHPRLNNPTPALSPIYGLVINFNCLCMKRINMESKVYNIILYFCEKQGLKRISANLHAHNKITIID